MEVEMSAAEKVSLQVLYPLGLSLEEAVIEWATPLSRLGSDHAG